MRHQLERDINMLVGQQALLELQYKQQLAAFTSLNNNTLDIARVD